MFGSYVNLKTAHNKGSSFQNLLKQKLSKMKSRPAEPRIDVLSLQLYAGYGRKNQELRYKKITSNLILSSRFIKPVFWASFFNRISGKIFRSWFQE